MTGDTRLVMAVRDCTAQQAVGCAVRQHGLLVDGSGGGGGDRQGRLELHDAVLRLIGFTLLQGDSDVHRCLLALLAAGEHDAALRCSHVTLCSSELAAMQRCIAAVQRWLSSRQRLVEGRSGLTLQRAMFVRVGNDGCVTEVVV
jgi:hypothetical protein